MKITHLAATFLIPAFSNATAAPTVYAYNDEGTRLRDFDNTPLYNGNSFSGGGDIFEIGYFSESSTGIPFAGTWNPLRTYRIGDKSYPQLAPGVFRYRDPISPSDLLGGTNLAVRFYDATSLDRATYFNTVTDAHGAWTWIPGVSSNPLVLSFADSTLLWQDGSGSAFRTTIPVPEPTSGLLCTAGLWYLLQRRFRRPSGASCGRGLAPRILFRKPSGTLCSVEPADDFVILHEPKSG